VFGRVGDDAAAIVDTDYVAVLARMNAQWALIQAGGGTNRPSVNSIYSPNPGWESFLLAGLVDLQFNEKFQAGLMGYYLLTEQNFLVPDSVKEWDLGVYAKFKFNPSVELKGIYYYQKLESGISQNTINEIATNGGDLRNLITQQFLTADRVDDNFKAWKAILKIEQDLLQFTDLQIEYSQIDNGFHLWTDPYSSIGNNVLENIDNADPRNTTKVLGVKAAQKWGESRWNSWLRYYRADYDDAGVDNAQNIGLGVGYQLNPAVHFELAADFIDFGNTAQHNQGGYEDEDVVVRFQTVVNF
jgi:hypothetical protein